MEDDIFLNKYMVSFQNIVQNLFCLSYTKQILLGKKITIQINWLIIAIQYLIYYARVPDEDFESKRCGFVN
jgi:hypothetical protein